MMPRHITTPLTRAMLAPLNAGDTVLLTGTLYTARDAAHARMALAITQGKPLPFDIKGGAIYYAGPTPTPPGLPVGSIGPTTAGRMDSFAPALLDMGLMAMVGKGERGLAVHQAMARNGAVYFGCIGGAGALYAKHVVAVEIIAYEDLGSEAIRRLTVEDFPLTVLATGKQDLYKSGRADYLRFMEGKNAGV